MKLKVNVDGDLLNECIGELQELIRIPSVKSEPGQGQPFGKSIDEALRHFLKLAERLGFKTRNLDGYIGMVEMGQGEEVLGILVHLDVVPANDLEQWKYPPFSGQIAEERLWGRGALDDKGPAMAVLYAMKQLKDLNLKWNKRIQLIIGTDEESTWEDIDYFKKSEPLPTMAFTPDGYFPLTTIEKGILTLSFEGTAGRPTLVQEFHAGDRFNSTPAEAAAVLQGDLRELHEKCWPSSVTIQWNDDSAAVLTAKGVAGHTSSPDQVKNPIAILLEQIGDILPPNDGFWPAIHFFENHLKNTNGEGIGCKMEDEVSGELTIAQSILELSGGSVRFINNLRIPSSVSIDAVIERCASAISGSPFQLNVLERKEPIHLDADTPFCRDLMAVYNDYFDTDAQPMSISGGTYARAFPNTVAFGALIPGKPLNAHQPNENIELSVIEDWITIYANAILRIASEGE